MRYAIIASALLSSLVVAVVIVIPYLLSVYYPYTLPQLPLPDLACNLLFPGSSSTAEAPAAATMLSYNTSVTVNGQRPATPGRHAAASATTAPRRSSALSNGVMTNGINGKKVGHPPRPVKEQHIWLVTGPAGCGKSTIAKYLADSLHFTFIEGDEYHPKANIDKMSAGIPLTDADRWDWLTALREASISALASGSDGVVLTCSALKRKYRDVIRVAPYFTPHLHLHFLYLDAPEEVLVRRVGMRQNHYMGANMVHSQFEALERPRPDEVDVITIDVTKDVDEVKRDALEQVLRTMEEEQDEP